MVPSIVQSERHGDHKGQACQSWPFFPPWSSCGSCQLRAEPAVSLLPPSLLCCTQGIGLQGKRLFSSLPIILGKYEPCLPSWNIFSSSEHPPPFFSQIVDVNTQCAYELVGRHFHRLEWTVWPYSLEKLQRAVSLVMEEKRTASQSGKHLENLQPASRCCREAIAPHSPILRYFLRAFLKVSSLQSTTLTYVLLDLSSECPYLFQ